MSGLKINFKKSRLFGIGIEHLTLVSWADRICCLIDSFPSKYLGLPLGVSSSSHAVWKPVIDKFEERLAGWKAQFLSMGGRVTLIKSVLSSLPVFFMSLLQMPCAVKDALDRIQRRFL